MTAPGGAGQAHDATAEAAPGIRESDLRQAEADATEAEAAVTRLQDKADKFDQHAASAREAIPAAEAEAATVAERLATVRAGYEQQNGAQD